jgi:hypothetical protein
MTKKQIEIKQNIIKKVEKSQILNNIFFFLLIVFGNGLDPAQMHGMGRTWPNHRGWAQPSPCEQCPPLFTCSVNSGGMAGTK